MDPEKLITPIDKKAAIVTCQKRCEEKLTNEQKRDNLKAQLKNLLEEHKKAKNYKHRKNLGIQIQEIQIKINALRPKKKTPGIEKYIIDILREDLSDFAFDRLFKRAAERWEKDNKK